MNDRVPLETALAAPQAPTARRWPFVHHRLEAFHVALDALVLGEAIARELPRGYGALADQLRRALQGAYLQVAEAAARSGADRLAGSAAL